MNDRANVNLATPKDGCKMLCFFVVCGCVSVLNFTEDAELVVQRTESSAARFFFGSKLTDVVGLE